MLNFIYEWYSSNEDLIAMNLLILLCIHGNVTLVSVIAKGTLIEEGSADADLSKIQNGPAWKVMKEPTLSRLELFRLSSKQVL